MSMITACLWVPRGAAAAFPEKYDVDEDELARISKLAKMQLDDANDGLNDVHNDRDEDSDNASLDSEEDNLGLQETNAQVDADDDLKEYDLDHYDSDPLTREGEPTTMFGNTASLAYHESNADDPYITVQNDDEDEEREDLQILATDNMLVAAKVEDEVAHLEMYVYEDEADNLYVHHDIMLPAIPLCVEWLDLPVGKDVNVVDPDSKGNYVAVGTFDPDIEIWDLDTIDCMYPNAILGQGGHDLKSDPADQFKKKKRKRSKKANDRYHVDAILSLAANRQHRNLLGSSSADQTIKLWDLKTAKCAKSYTHHTDKVCSVAWNPRDSAILLSGSYDRTVVVADVRAPDAKVPRWGVESDVEIVMWNPHDPDYFFVTTEDGVIHFHDTRMPPKTPETSKAVWTLHAHDESISAFDVNPTIPGFLATGSSDKTVKLWNVQASGPSMVVSRNVEVGKVFTTKFAPDSEVAFRLAVAGSKGAMQVWDTSTNAAVRKTFASRIAATDEEDKKERIIGIAEDSSDSEEEGGMEPGNNRAATANEGHNWESMDGD
ncbi:rRNA-processing protein [Lecanora helva]